MMKKVLIIAYVFPPIAYAGTHRTLRLCKHLATMGYSLDILTINVQDDLHNDFQLLDSIKDQVNIIRTPILDPHRLHRRLTTRLKGYYFSRLIASISGNLSKLISKPDHMVYWILSAIKPALKLIKLNRYQIIYTTSPPHSEQIIGYLLKKIKPSIKWIADMRDPLLDNLLIDRMSTFDRMLHKYLENKIANCADAVIFNTKKAQRRFNDRYAHAMTRLVRNSYNENDFGNIELPRFKQFTISHVGSIYSFRNVDALFEVVAKLSENNAIDEDKFRILFVGMTDGSLARKIQQYGIEKFVEIRDMIPHREAIEMMCKSHLLLLVKGFGKKSDSQIPGKLYEYLASGNSIIHIGPTESEAAEIIAAENAGRTFSDIDGLYKYIEEKYSNFQSDTEGVAPKGQLKKFSSKNMAGEMHAIFQSV